MRKERVSCACVAKQGQDALSRALPCYVLLMRMQPSHFTNCIQNLDTASSRMQAATFPITISSNAQNRSQRMPTPLQPPKTPTHAATERFVDKPKNTLRTPTLLYAHHFDDCSIMQSNN
jgi:hypothetical protein